MASRGAVKVVVNVYDLTPSNDLTHQFGIGAFHSGLEVYGTEYSFGGGESSGSGIFGLEPRTAPGCRYRETVEIGTTRKSMQEVQSLVSGMGSDWPANSYNLVNRNCNSYCDALAKELCGVGIPGYINRLAWMGSWFSCMGPMINKMLGAPPAASGGEGGAAGGAASGAVARPVAAPSVTPFTGQAQSVGGSTSRSGDDGDVRSRIAQAALRRMESDHQAS